MSSAIVPLTPVSKVLPHPNADKLDVAEINGWQTVVARGSVSDGDIVIYVAPDLIVPQEWSDRWGVTKYLSNQRVRSAKLRGEPSFGFVIKPGIDEYAALFQAGAINGPDLVPCENVAHVFGIGKYEPKIRATGLHGLGGKARAEDPRLNRFTDIENLRHFPSGFTEGQEVWVTEKIHGTNSRLALIDGEWMAASKRVQRERDVTEADDVQFQTSRHDTYWYPMGIEGVRNLIGAAADEGHKQVILFGEIYGPSIQKFGYGLNQGELGYVAFDLMLDGKYVDAPTFSDLCEAFSVPQAPVLYVGPYDKDRIKSLTLGRSLLGGTHIREGVVVRPITEERDPKFGRRILKLVSDEYLTGNVEDLQEEAA